MARIPYLVPDEIKTAELAVGLRNDCARLVVFRQIGSDGETVARFAGIATVAGNYSPGDVRANRVCEEACGALEKLFRVFARLIAPHSDYMEW